MCVATLILALLLSACGGGGGASPSAAATPVIDLAAADLDLLLERLERTHPEPFHAIPRPVWVAELEALEARLPDLAPPEAMVELMRVVALLSREQYANSTVKNVVDWLVNHFRDPAVAYFIDRVEEEDSDVIESLREAIEQRKKSSD